MTHDELVTELQARSLSELTDARASRYINNAMRELDRKFLWPWREQSVTGTAPIQIADLAVVEAVIDVSQSDRRMVPRQYKDLLDWYGDLSTAGTPMYYYRASPSGVQTIATYPTSSDTIGVQYWKVTAEITGSQEPESPDEAHELIVDLAQRRALRDLRDHEGAEAMQSEIDRQIDDLWTQYQPGIADETSVIVASTNVWGW